MSIKLGANLNVAYEAYVHENGLQVTLTAPGPSRVFVSDTITPEIAEQIGRSLIAGAKRVRLHPKFQGTVPVPSNSSLAHDIVTMIVENLRNCRKLELDALDHATRDELCNTWRDAIVQILEGKQ